MLQHDFTVYEDRRPEADLRDRLIGLVGIDAVAARHLPLRLQSRSYRSSC